MTFKTASGHYVTVTRQPAGTEFVTRDAARNVVSTVVHGATASAQLLAQLRHAGRA